MPGCKDCIEKFTRYCTLTVTKIIIGLSALLFLAGGIFLIAFAAYANNSEIAAEIDWHT